MAKAKTATPASLGFRMPAEWSPQTAVWLSWPHKRASWPGMFRPIPYVFAGIVAQISRFEEVRINIAAPLQKRAWSLITKAGADLSKVTLYDHPTNDAWCRDHGPIFVKNQKTGELAVTDWVHTAWGGKYPPYDLDNTIPPLVAKKLKLRRFENDMVLEGGSIEVNGAGTLLTTEACLLNPNRNPELTKEQIEANLRDYLGVEQILWLGDGIVGDDTDGHIDDLTRFTDATTLVTIVEPDKSDENFELLRENRARLEKMRTPKGKPWRIVELPTPGVIEREGQRLPASYANFYIANNVVIMPGFDHPNDARAAAILQELFPTRRVITWPSLDLIWGLGALHCITQQQPAARA